MKNRPRGGTGDPCCPSQGTLLAPEQIKQPRRRRDEAAALCDGFCAAASYRGADPAAGPKAGGFLRRVVQPWTRWLWPRGCRARSILRCLPSPPAPAARGERGVAVGACPGGPPVWGRA